MGGRGPGPQDSQSRRQEVIGYWGCPGTGNRKSLVGRKPWWSQAPDAAGGCQQAAVSRRERFEQHRATRPQQPGDAGRSRAPWPLSHMDSLGPRIPAPNLSPGRRAMCWISAIRSVGWPWDWGFGRWCRPMPSEPLEEAHMGDGPHRGCGGDPQDPAHSAGVGAQARASHPPHSLPFGSCVRTQCV